MCRYADYGTDSFCNILINFIAGDILFSTSFQDNECTIPLNTSARGLPICSKGTDGNYELISCINTPTVVPSLLPSATAEPTSTFMGSTSLSTEPTSVVVNPTSQNRRQTRSTFGLEITDFNTQIVILTFAFLVILAWLNYTWTSNPQKMDKAPNFENSRGSNSACEGDVASPKQSSILSPRKVESMMESTFIDIPAPMSTYDTHDSLLNDSLNDLYGSLK